MSKVNYQEQYAEFSEEEINTVLKIREQDSTLAHTYSIRFMLEFTRDWNNAVNKIKK